MFGYKNARGCVSAKETIDSELQEAIRNRKERNAKDRAERRESRFRSATREEIDHLSWRIAIKTGPDPGPYTLRDVPCVLQSWRHTRIPIYAKMWKSPKTKLSHVQFLTDDLFIQTLGKTKRLKISRQSSTKRANFWGPKIWIDPDSRYVSNYRTTDLKTVTELKTPRSKAQSFINPRFHKFP